MQQGRARSSTTRSTCSSSTASRWSTCRSRSGRQRLRELLDGRSHDRRASRRASTTATRSSTAAQEQGLEGIMAKRRGSRVRAGAADARLAEGEDARPRGVRRRRLHARLGQRGPGRSARSCSRSTRAASSATSATSAPGSTTREIRRLLALLRPLERDRVAVRRRAEDAAGAQGRRQWVEPRLVAEVEFSEWTHDGHVRQPVVQGAARGQARGRGRARASRCRGRRSARASASCGSRTSTSSSGRRRGSRRAICSRYYRRDRAGARAAPARPAVHDAPLPRRRRREGVLPEGRAVAHAGLDPDPSRRSSRRARAGGRRSGSSSRS